MRHIAQFLSPDLSNYFKVGHPASHTMARNTAVILKFSLLPSFEEFKKKKTLNVKEFLGLWIHVKGLHKSHTHTKNKF